MAEKKQVNNNEERENTSPKKRLSAAKVVLIGFGLFVLGSSRVMENLCSAGNPITLSLFSFVFGVLIMIAGVIYNFQTPRDNKKK